jgi:hypothetical protein
LSLLQAAATFAAADDHKHSKHRVTARAATDQEEHMGLFKQLKDMKGMIEDAPEMIRGAQAMGAQAQQMAAAQQAAAQAQMAAASAQFQTAPAPGTAAAADYEAISGVSLELYAEISKGLAAVGYDQSKAPEIAATHGVSADSWQAAVDGWNDRIKSTPEIASRFNALYTGRA